MKKRKLHECIIVDLDSSLTPIDTTKKTRSKRLKFDDKIEMLIYERPAVE